MNFLKRNLKSMRACEGVGFWLIFFELDIIISKSGNVLDVRASLKVVLQMEQVKFPSH